MHSNSIRRTFKTNAVFEAIALKFEKQLNEFKEIAQARYLSWKEHPEYIDVLEASFAKMKEHMLSFDPQIAKKLLETVLEVRLFNQDVFESYKKGEFKGASLRSVGQEAIGAGIGVSLRSYDVTARSHRDISLSVARGTPIEDFWCNNLMKKTTKRGRSMGHDGSTHFADFDLNDLGFMISDMAIANVVINGGVWFMNTKREFEKGSPLSPDERSCGVAIVGDGASSNGVSFAGMNFAKAWRLPVNFWIHNNQLSLRTSPNEQHGGIELSNRGFAFEMPLLSIDGMNVYEVYFASYLFTDFSRHANHPALIHALDFRVSNHNDTEDGGYVEEMFGKEFHEFWTAREQDPLYRAKILSEKLDYIGESGYKELREEVKERVKNAYTNAFASPDPTPDDLRTALIDPECSVVKKLSDAHPPSGVLKNMTFKEALQSAFREQFRKDPLLLMLGEDIGRPGGGVFAVTAGLLEEFGDRIRNSTLDEACIAGFLAGACLLGAKVIGEYQFWYFFLAGANIPLTLCATRPFMQGVGVSGVLRGPTGYAPQSNHYHESLPETYLLKSLGIKVVVPATPKAAKGLMNSAIQDPDLVAVLEEMSYYEMREDVPEGEFYLPFEPITRREGKDITLVTWGPKMLELGLTSAERFAGGTPSIDIEVIDLQVLHPWDLAKKHVFDSLRKTGKLIVLHEDSEFMGFGAEICASVFTSKEFYGLKARGQRVAAQNIPIPVHLVLEDSRLPDFEKLQSAVWLLMRESEEGYDG
ncbi:MAG: thiamine pyrophosphate-dependent enzyme [bacterium]|nr:thiamine pyrophosphate-dependent enzyme [bacterium]